jgi:hypothetical protein
VGQLAGRLSRLEERRRLVRPLRSERERFEDWQLRVRIRRDRKTPRSVKVCRSRIAWLRLVGKLSDFESAEELIADVMTAPDGSGGRQPPEERSRTLVEREVFAAIWRQDEGLGHLELPPEWAEMLAAADEWRAKMLSVPVQELAHWVIAIRALIQQEAGEAGEKIDGLCAECLGPYGVDEQLLERVVGPDRAVLTSEEVGWMIHGPLQGDYCSEWAWQVGEAVREIDEREGGR